MKKLFLVASISLTVTLTLSFSLFANSADLYQAITNLGIDPVCNQSTCRVAIKDLHCTQEEIKFANFIFKCHFKNKTPQTFNDYFKFHFAINVKAAKLLDALFGEPAVKMNCNYSGEFCSYFVKEIRCKKNLRTSNSFSCSFK